MNYKKIFKISPLRIIIFVFIGFAIYFSRLYCRPFIVMSGASLADGSVGGGVVYSCGQFSKWLWGNPEVLNLYNSIKSWHIILFIVFLWLVSNLIIELIVSRRNNRE